MQTTAPSYRCHHYPANIIVRGWQTFKPRRDRSAGTGAACSSGAVLRRACTSDGLQSDTSSRLAKVPGLPGAQVARTSALVKTTAGQIISTFRAQPQIDAVTAVICVILASSAASSSPIVCRSRKGAAMPPDRGVLGTAHARRSPEVR
jgi:hypothetical protein